MSFSMPKTLTLRGHQVNCSIYLFSFLFWFSSHLSTSSFSSSVGDRKEREGSKLLFFLDYFLILMIKKTNCSPGTLVEYLKNSVFFLSWLNSLIFCTTWSPFLGLVNTCNPPYKCLHYILFNSVRWQSSLVKTPPPDNPHLLLDSKNQQERDEG